MEKKLKMLILISFVISSVLYIIRVFLLRFWIIKLFLIKKIFLLQR